jgi:hypothetical protein
MDVADRLGEGFVVERRDTMELKGKEEMETCFLVGSQ